MRTTTCIEVRSDDHGLFAGPARRHRSRPRPVPETRRNYPHLRLSRLGGDVQARGRRALRRRQPARRPSRAALPPAGRRRRGSGRRRHGVAGRRGGGRRPRRRSLADIFGIDLDPADSGAAAARQRTTGRRRPRRGRPRRTAPPSGFQPTGRRVAELRRRGGFSVPEFAGLLRVSASTVYRWEAARGPLALRAGQETATREGVSHECGLWGDPLCADAQNREKMLDTHRRRPVADRRRVHAVLCGAPPHLHGWARPARAQPGAELEIGGG